MLKNSVTESAILVVSAKLSKDIEIVRRGFPMKFEAGTEVFVDVNHNIGLIQGLHIQLSDEDFQVSHLN